MLGQEVSFTFIKPNNTIPYYFDASEIAEIFSEIAAAHPCSKLRGIH